MTEEKVTESLPLLCSNCFADEGLKINAYKLGVEQGDDCPNCHSSDGRKLTKEKIEHLAHQFFVRGTFIQVDYGAAPQVQCNPQHYGRSDVELPSWLQNDLKIIEKAAQLGIFYYGPRLWMVGEVEPLKALQDPAGRAQIIERIIKEYPVVELDRDEKFYRLRVNPQHPSNPQEYDSPPAFLAGKGRLDSEDFPVMYGSQDVDICIHECRTSAEDDIYVATIKTQKALRLLDLTYVLDEDVTEFESLDMAIHMLFLAKSHSYQISRSIALAAQSAGFDGVIYPSFFSLIRTGGHPFETVFGLSVRRHHPDRKNYAAAYTIPNFALFGRPLDEGKVRVDCINRLVLTHIGYQGSFGPVLQD